MCTNGSAPSKNFWENSSSRDIRCISFVNFTFNQVVLVSNHWQTLVIVEVASSGIHRNRSGCIGHFTQQLLLPLFTPLQEVREHSPHSPNFDLPPISDGKPEPVNFGLGCWTYLDATEQSVWFHSGSQGEGRPVDAESGDFLSNYSLNLF